MSEFVDIQTILQSLPHRYPFLLVDRVLDFTSHKTLRALKNVTYNEPFFMGHFPERPIMPGVLIIEALAQASGMLTVLSDQHDPKDLKKYLYYLAGIDNARFKQVVVPGDQLILEVEITRTIRDIRQCKAQASVNGKIVCSADIMSARKEAP